MPEHDVRDTLGAILVGGGFAAILTGVVSTQTMHYIQHYQDDKAPTKLMVIFVWCLDILHTIMIFMSAWMWLIGHFGDAGVANWIPWSLGVTVVLTAMVTVIVHTFFLYRIYALSKGNWFVVGPILVLAAIRLGLASTSCAKMLILGSFSEFVDKMSWVFTMGLVTSSVLDVLTTGCLLWYLDRARTGFAGMDQIINTLSLYAVENGLLTSLAVVASLGFWLGMGKNLVFVAVYFSVAKLYANSLLATLNSRRQLRERNRSASCSDGNVSVTVFNPRRATQKRSVDYMTAVQINVEKTSIRHDDEVDISLSKIGLQAETEKHSIETTTTSQTVILEGPRTL